jgi:hypothetical protein
VKDAEMQLSQIMRFEQKNRMETFESIFGLEIVLLLFGFTAERNCFGLCAGCGSNFFKDKRHQRAGRVKML